MSGERRIRGAKEKGRDIGDIRGNTRAKRIPYFRRMDTNVRIFDESSGVFSCPLAAGAAVVETAVVLSLVMAVLTVEGAEERSSEELEDVEAMS